MKFYALKYKQLDLGLLRRLLMSWTGQTEIYLRILKSIRTANL